LGQGERSVLEFRPCCETCGIGLPPESTAARICSFECTFCAACQENVLKNVCPNCGGGLYPRPIRPSAMLERYPAAGERVLKPLDLDKQAALLARYRDLLPEQR
jgi:hypothetical protein